MGYKLNKTLKDNKKSIIIILVLWVILSIVLVAPIGYSIGEASKIGAFKFDVFIENVVPAITSFSSIGKVFSEGYAGIFGKTLIYFTIIYAIFTMIGLFKSRPKHEYTDIEHGSSDWSEGGEQYHILSRNKGIILAQNNYLPIDKRGNINVLVVGGSGSGKSASYSIPNAFQMLGSYVFTDPKGELYDKTAGYLRKNGYEIKVLNLFAYTGGATVACLSAGASVCHVDSSKGMVSWAKENVTSSGLQDRKVRYIVDDVVKFVNREIRRGNKYNAIIMDPPSYGRGTNGEVWKFEDNIYDLVELCSKVLTDKPLFFLINSYTTGISSMVLENILKLNIHAKGKFSNGEIGIPMQNSNLVLPCGIYGRWES